MVKIFSSFITLINPDSYLISEGLLVPVFPTSMLLALNV